MGPNVTTALKQALTATYILSILLRMRTAAILSGDKPLCQAARDLGVLAGKK
jgi:hypothetical protein